MKLFTAEFLQSQRVVKCRPYGFNIHVNQEGFDILSGHYQYDMLRGFSRLCLDMKLDMQKIRCLSVCSHQFAVVAIG